MVAGWIFLVAYVVSIVAATYAQYMYDQNMRLKDAIEYMVEDEIAEEVSDGNEGDVE